LAKRLLVRNHLASAAEADRRAVVIADGPLHRHAIALGPGYGRVERSNPRHAVSSAELDVIAARKSNVFLLVPQPPGHVDMPAVTVRVVVRHALQRRNHP